MLGFGRIQGKDQEGTLDYAMSAKNRFPHLKDATGNWRTHRSVRNVRVMGEDCKVFRNE